MNDLPPLPAELQMPVRDLLNHSPYASYQIDDHRMEIRLTGKSKILEIFGVCFAGGVGFPLLFCSIQYWLSDGRLPFVFPLSGVLISALFVGACLQGVFFLIFPIAFTLDKAEGLFSGRRQLSTWLFPLKEIVAIQLVMEDRDVKKKWEQFIRRTIQVHFLRFSDEYERITIVSVAPKVGSFLKQHQTEQEWVTQLVDSISKFLNVPIRNDGSHWNI